jgi:alginate O-acetyltransferase complex protein AlgI
MVFSSFVFVLGFLPLTLCVFYAAAARSRLAAKAWLVIASLAFYTWWYPPFVLLLLVSICFNYASGVVILRLAGQRMQTWALASAISVNLLALFYYKYAYTLATFLFHAGITPGVFMHNVLLPLGISFFTFTQIGFLIDCKDGAVSDRNPINYVLFVTFFPHLIAGPILHHREIMPQFAADQTYRVQWHNLAQGFSLFAIGLFKKVVLADPISVYANPGFASPEHLTLFPAWGSVLSYSLQLYFDFSGYSDMAIGIGQMCNVQFPLNFNSPYKAPNIIEFWQRWHMTLTRYLTLYLYSPIALWVTRRRMARGLSVSKRATATLPAFASMIALPVFFTMLPAGVWHGAGWQFFVFGLLHGCYLTINHAWRIFGPKAEPRSKAVRRTSMLACVLLTYIAVVIAQVFFRANSFADALAMLAGMVGLHGAVSPIPVPYWLPDALGSVGGWLAVHDIVHGYSTAGWFFRQVLILGVAYGIVWLAPNSQEIAGRDTTIGGKTGERQTGVPAALLRMNVSWGVALGLVALIAIMGIGAHSEFIYFQF